MIWMVVWYEDLLELSAWYYIGEGGLCIVCGQDLREECVVKEDCLCRGMECFKGTG